MARTLTKKQRVFVDRKADGETGVAAVLNNYDTKDYDTAKSIAAENLTKPYLVEELKKLGFDSSNAKRVVGEILNSGDDTHKLSAADKVFKVNGDYAPEKLAVAIQEVVPNDRLKVLADKLNK